ncbi:metal ABC transporter substrate-binding protein [Raineyella antarctica]|nr:metal ABC transporter substrate-binding protein [Raineyella antarctica]
MNHERLLAGAAALTCLTLLSACGTSSNPAQHQAGTPVRVVAAVYPYQWLTEQIGGDKVQVEGLLKPGADAHDLELTPKQVADVTQLADLVVYESHLQAPVDNAVAGGTKGRALDTTTLVQDLVTTTDASGHDGETPATTQAEHQNEDPHLWLDPTNMATVAVAIRDQLSAIDPSAAATFTANTDKVVADLKGLDTEYSSGLAHCDRKVFITSHEAFGYLAHRYGLEQIAVRGLDASVEPTAARIVEVQNIAKQEGVTTIFYETALSPAVSQSIAKDGNLRTDVLDPLEAAPQDTARGADYPGVMRANLQALRTANGCR